MLAMVTLTTLCGRDREEAGRYVNLDLYEMVAVWNAWDNSCAERA